MDKNIIKSTIYRGHSFSVAPMMDWTDRHCRYLHRCFSKQAVLYTEMITAHAVLYGDRQRLLSYHPAEHPVALQLGGSDPDALAQATRIAADYEYDEINLNIGCPSDKVQSGRFGACLMREPALVADCVSAMISTSGPTEISVKCRIGIDDQDPEKSLPEFLETVSAAGVKNFIIHARKAWLEGLNPKENRTIPPLDYNLVLQMSAAFPHLKITLNGGIANLEQALEFYKNGIHGVMIGRAAYQHPSAILGSVDRLIFGVKVDRSAEDIVSDMVDYIDDQQESGQRLNQITRHMLGLFNGRPGARRWRQILSENAHKPGANTKLVIEALKAIEPMAG